MRDELKRDLIFDITEGTRVLMAWPEYAAMWQRIGEAEHALARATEAEKVYCVLLNMAVLGAAMAAGKLGDGAARDEFALAYYSDLLLAALQSGALVEAGCGLCGVQDARHGLGLPWEVPGAESVLVTDYRSQ
jgi:hypothetical protein